MHSRLSKSIPAFLVLCACSHAYPEFLDSLYIGAKGGTPISSSVSSAVAGGRGGSGLSTLNVRRYTVGPTFEVALPFGFRFEADALYKRLDRTDHRFLAPTFGTITRHSANTWEFPLLLKHPWRRGRLRPFAAGGGTFRRIQSFDGSAETFAGGFQPPYAVRRYRVDEPLTQGGMVFSAGVRLMAAGPLKVTPEIRYTRYTSSRFLPTENQVEFLVGVGF
jgi:hypothetical protein